MGVAKVQLAEGRDASVVRLGSPGGQPVLYFHSPASSGEELIGAGEEAARELGLELLAIVRRSIAAHDTGRLGSVVPAVHLVSPLPGPLIGPDPVPHQSQRLRQIARTSPTSSWVTAPGALRDYLAVVAPWPFDVRSVVQPVTIWAPTDDEIVPALLVDHLARQLPHTEMIEVAGSHDWIRENWSVVLRRVATL